MSRFRRMRKWFVATVMLACHFFLEAEPADAALSAAQIRHIVLSRGENPAAVAQLVQLARQLDDEAAAQLFGELADDYLRAGHLDLAGTVMQQLVDQFPDQPAATENLVKLVRLYASSETTHGQRDPKRSAAPTSSKAIYALHVAQQVRRRQPQLAKNPALAFQCAVAARRGERQADSIGWLTPLKHNPRLQPWHGYAVAEDWLQSSRKEPPPRPTLLCHNTEQRPYLDGKFADRCWLTAQTLPIPWSQLTAANENQADLRVAYDAEFLYVALRCPKVAKLDYSNDSRPRTRDADLSQHDRVRLLLDVDRDYATWFQFVVDHRGWTTDTCWLDKTWNPQWYVATGEDNNTWTIEAAIPWTELTHKSPGAQQAWALAVERELPQQASATKGNTPQSEPRPEGFVLLLFE